MKKKIIFMFSGLFFLAVFNTFLITNVFAETGNTKSSAVEPDGGTYYCFWWADQWGSGSWARDCDCCVLKQMTNPSMLHTCSTNLFE